MLILLRCSIYSLVIMHIYTSIQYQRIYFFPVHIAVNLLHDINGFFNLFMISCKSLFQSNIKRI